MTFSTDNVQRKGNLVFAVRQKQGVTCVGCLRRCFKPPLLENIGYQSDAGHGTEGIIYTNPYLFGLWLLGCIGTGTSVNRGFG